MLEHHRALHATASATRMLLSLLTAVSWLGAACSQAPPPAAIPYSKCIGCEQDALLPVHFVSKKFYCHPDGSLADKSCAAAHGSPAACCAACLKVNAEKQMCDAWFMNEQGGCFFKNCPPSAWKSGECHVDPKPATVSDRSDSLCTLPFLSHRSTSERLLPSTHGPSARHVEIIIFILC